jgi:hypothetical protein
MKRPDTSVLAADPLLRRVWERMGRPPGCRAVGGYVRDRLLGRSTRDLDLTLDGEVDAAGRPVRRLAGALGLRPHLLGTPPHRVWRIDGAELKVEVWPLGELSREADLLRRDFTVNSLAWELPAGPLVDLVGGLADLRGGLLRAIGRSNLADDPVRLLRGPRFLAQLPGFELEPTTRGWIRELASRLADAPRERVGAELLALLHGGSPSRGLGECLELGLFGPTAPPGAHLDVAWTAANLAALDRLGGATATADGGARLGFLVRAWGLPADGDLAAYAWPKSDRELAGRAARLLDQAAATAGAPAADRRELAWRAGAAFPTLIALAAALEPDRAGWRRWRRQWRRTPEGLSDPKPLLTGGEIAERTGIAPGPELGEVVGALTRAQVRGAVRSRSGAIRWLEGGG